MPEFRTCMPRVFFHFQRNFDRAFEGTTNINYCSFPGDCDFMSFQLPLVGQSVELSLQSTGKMFFSTAAAAAAVAASVPATAAATLPSKLGLL